MIINHNGSIICGLFRTKNMEDITKSNAAITLKQDTMMNRFVTNKQVNPVNEIKNPEKYWINAMTLKKEKKVEIKNSPMHRMIFTLHAELKRAMSQKSVYECFGSLKNSTI